MGYPSTFKDPGDRDRERSAVIEDSREVALLWALGQDNQVRALGKNFRPTPGLVTIAQQALTSLGVKFEQK